MKFLKSLFIFSLISYSGLCQKSAQDFYNDAVKKEEQGDYAAALSEYDKAINKFSQYSDAFYKRALIKAILKDTIGALQDLQKCILLKPSFIEAYEKKLMFKKMIGDTIGNAKDSSKLIEIKSSYCIENTRKYTIAAAQFSENGNQRRAIEEYTKAINYCPHYYRLYFLRALFEKNEIGDYIGAIEDNNITIKLNPKYVYAYHNIGIDKSMLLDYTGAIESYSKALELYVDKEDKILVLLDLASCKSNLYLYDDAISDLNKILELRSSNKSLISEAYLRLSTISIIKSLNMQTALEQINQAIKYDKKNAAAYVIRCCIYMTQKNEEMAKKDFVIAVQMGVDSAFIREGIGYFLMETGNYPMAIEYFDQLIKVDSNNYEAYNSRAWAKFKIANYDGAYPDILKAYNNDSSAAHILDTKGCVLYGLKQYQEAIEDFNRAISMYSKKEGVIVEDSPISNSYLYRGLCKYETGDKNGGCDDIQKAVELKHIEANKFYNKYCK